MAKKAALLVVDMQKEFFGYKEAQSSLQEALEYINYMIEKFREAGQPVIFIADEEAGGGKESEGYELSDELDYTEEDIFISKTHCNSFWNTELDSKLKELGVELVVVCGFAAEYCVYGTYNGAMERGYRPVLLQHGIASTNKEHLKMIEDICNTASYAVLEYILK